MTNRELDHDALDDAEQEAQLYYRAVARKKDEKKGATGPLPVAGGAGSGAAPAAGATNPGAPAANMGGGMSAPAGAVPMAAGGAALGATAAPEAAADVRFDSEPLAAGSAAPADDDPWGAYDNPDGIPGLSLDDEESRDRRGGSGMALRGSGTRGKSDSGGGRMAPMMPMGGAGAGTGAAGAQAVPGATVGGVGAVPNLAAGQQQAAVQAAMSGAQQGSIPMSTLNGLGAARASNAMTAPPASGVMAAGSDGLPVAPGALEDTMRQMNGDTNNPYVVGPDGNLYPNPYYRGDDPTTPGDDSHWSQDRVNDGPGSHMPGGPGSPIPSDGDNSLPEGPGIYPDVPRVQPDMPHVQPDMPRVLPDRPDVFPDMPRTFPDGPVTPHPGPDDGGPGSDGGVGDDISDLNQDDYNPSPGTPTGPGGPTAPGGGPSGIGGGDWSTPAPSTGTNPFTRQYGTKSFGQGTNFTVSSDELRGEAKEWERLSSEQEALAKQFKALPDPNPIFGVLKQMVSPYATLQNESMETAYDYSGGAETTSTNLDQSAVSYQSNEYDSAKTSEGINY